MQPQLFEMDEDTGPADTASSRPAKPEAEKASPLAGENVQPEGEISFDGHAYTYTGYALEGGQYVRRTARFTPDEVCVYAEEPLWRVCAMADAVGRDEARQAEIKRYGKRAWHSPFRTSSAVLQGLDYIFRHDVDLIYACCPYVEAFYANDATAADRWTAAMYDAYKAFALRGQQEALLRLLAQVGIPPVLVLDRGTLAKKRS